MNNIVDLFNDIKIKKNDITGFNEYYDNDKKEILNKIRNKMNCRKEDSEKEDNEKLKDKILYKQKIKGLATSIFLSLLESFSEIRNDIRYNYENHTSDILVFKK